MPQQRETTAAAPRAEELAGVGVWSIDLVSGVLTTNAAARSMLEWDPDRGEPAVTDFLAAVHPEDAGLVAELAERLLAHGQEYAIEHRVLLPGSGRTLDVRATACAERDADGRIRVLHGITLDLTDLARTVREREEERDRVRAVLEGLTEGYWLAVDGTIVEVSEALCRMTGFAAEELVGASFPYSFWPNGQEPGLCSTQGRSADRQAELVRCDGSRLPVALRATALARPDGPATHIVLVRDTTAERDYERQLELRATTDPLTGVHNSRAFREALRASVAARRMAPSPLSLALIDIDHFKAVNDRYGHAVGDEVLVAVVERLVAATRHLGTLARVGGEEFALLLPGVELEAAREVVAGALAALRDSPLPEVGRVTASAGVAGLSVALDDSALYRLADARMYQAKHQGRDQVC